MSNSNNTTTTKRVRIKVISVGTRFGHRGIIQGMNGRKLGESRVVPYGMQHAARDLAESLAAANGWTVVSLMGDE